MVVFVSLRPSLCQDTCLLGANGGGRGRLATINCDFQQKVMIETNLVQVLILSFATRLRHHRSSERRRHSRQEVYCSTEVHGHPALPSLQNGGDKLKIFALEQRSLLEPEDHEDVQI